MISSYITNDRLTFLIFFMTTKRAHFIKRVIYDSNYFIVAWNLDKGICSLYVCCERSDAALESGIITNFCLINTLSFSYCVVML